MSGPKLLDLCGGLGGAAVGYTSAGWDVTSVDINPQPLNPTRFIQSEGIQYLIDHGQEYDAVHASWPCQGYSWATPKCAKLAKKDAEYSTDLIAACREVCDAYSLPLIMENVREARAELDLMQAPTCSYCPECDCQPEYERGWREPIMLCGEMFGLGVIRHRFFEVGGCAIPQPEHLAHRGSIRDGTYVTVAGHGADNPKGNNRLIVWRHAMGMAWATDRHGLAESIPPAYTDYIGSHLLAWL